MSGKAEVRLEGQAGTLLGTWPANTKVGTVIKGCLSSVPSASDGVLLDGATRTVVRPKTLPAGQFIFRPHEPKAIEVETTEALYSTADLANSCRQGKRITVVGWEGRPAAAKSDVALGPKTAHAVIRDIFRGLKALTEDAAGECHAHGAIFFEYSALVDGGLYRTGRSVLSDVDNLIGNPVTSVSLHECAAATNFCVEVLRASYPDAQPLPFTGVIDRLGQPYCQLDAGALAEDCALICAVKGRLQSSHMLDLAAQMQHVRVGHSQYGIAKLAPYAGALSCLAMPDKAADAEALQHYAQQSGFGLFVGGPSLTDRLPKLQRPASATQPSGAV
ncbi:hypothetical protein WJX73_001241 [Symbiochloris irregularis]|uniref:Uncharacterized protein n=1 Tax=Symbiochloris irregularis TaxID=706552 RepID=A0AAW1NXW6_9CHLO